MNEKETDLYNNIIQAANVINKQNQSGAGNYIIMGSNSAMIFNEMLEEYEYNQRIEVLRKNRKQKLEKLKEIRNNL